jgi:hypothetical protein
MGCVHLGARITGSSALFGGTKEVLVKYMWGGRVRRQLGGLRVFMFNSKKNDLHTIHVVRLGQKCGVKMATVNLCSVI